jgi:hypothetical protein
MGIGGHSKRDWAVGAVAEVPKCDIDERLKVLKKFFLGTFRESPKVFHSFNLGGENGMRNPFVTRGFYVLPKRFQSLIDTPYFIPDVGRPSYFFLNIIRCEIGFAPSFGGVSDFAKLKKRVLDQNSVQVSET